MEPLFFASTTTLVHLIRTGEVTSQTVVEAHLARIAQVNPQLNAVVQLAAESALADAQAADAALARGDNRGPLHGVPFTVKDWIETAGVICAAGDETRRTFVPAQDATVVARLRQAGGIFLGKTNVTVTNPVYGRTNNPYNLAYSPSGSSSGEAAIIAAGGSPLGLGSDSGGSIRTPAFCCGIAGLKPTTGRVPLTGHMPYISAMNDPRTVIGPMARRVEDLALAFGIIQGVDWRDASVAPVPVYDWRAVELRHLRVAFYTEQADAHPDPDCKTATISAALALQSEVASVEEKLPPRIDEAYAITRNYWRRPESALLDEWQPDGEFHLSSEQVEEHLFVWNRFRQTLIQFMEHHDVIITPVMELPAQPHGQPEGGIAYTLAYSLVGYPAVVVRVGTSPDGLPLGVQVVARPWREDVALAVAAFLETRFGGWQPPTRKVTVAATLLACYRKIEPYATANLSYPHRPPQLAPVSRHGSGRSLRLSCAAGSHPVSLLGSTQPRGDAASVGAQTDGSQPDPRRRPLVISGCSPINPDGDWRSRLSMAQSATSTGRDWLCF